MVSWILLHAPVIRLWQIPLLTAPVICLFHRPLFRMPLLHRPCDMPYSNALVHDVDTMKCNGWKAHEQPRMPQEEPGLPSAALPVLPSNPRIARGLQLLDDALLILGRHST